MGLREGKEGEEIRGAEETTTVLVGLQGQWLGRADSHEHTESNTQVLPRAS